MTKQEDEASLPQAFRKEIESLRAGVAEGAHSALLDPEKAMRARGMIEHLAEEKGMSNGCGSKR